MLQKFKVNFVIQQKTEQFAIAPTDGSNCYFRLRKAIQRDLGHAKFWIYHQDASGSKKYCSNDETLQEAIEYRVLPPAPSTVKVEPSDSSSTPLPAGSADRIVCLYVTTVKPLRPSKARSQDEKPKLKKPDITISFAASAASADSDGDTDGDAGQEVQHSSITGFRRDTTVSSVKRSYAHRTGIPVEALEFKLRGKGVSDDRTLGSLKMKNENLEVTWDPAVEKCNPPIQLRFLDHEENEVVCKVHVNSTMYWIKKRYLHQLKTNDQATRRFRFNGQSFRDTDTPAKLQMENDDVIDVFTEQTGGANECR